MKLAINENQRNFKPTNSCEAKVSIEQSHKQN